MPRPRGVRADGYEERRQLLLQRMSPRLAQLDSQRPSLRELAAAAGVTTPTLRHYFGGRDEILEAYFEEQRRRGEAFIARAAAPNGELEASVVEFLQSFAFALRTRGLGAIVAVALVEGLLNRRLGPAALKSIVDPAIDALAARLRAHAAAGDLDEVDPRLAALALISPVLIATQHQDQMFGAQSNPLEVEALIRQVAADFTRLHRRPSPGAAASPAS